MQDLDEISLCDLVLIAISKGSVSPSVVVVQVFSRFGLQTTNVQEFFKILFLLNLLASLAWSIDVLVDLLLLAPAVSVEVDAKSFE